MSDLSRRPQGAVVGETLPHESAALHVTGRALYTDDLTPRTKAVLHAWPVQSPHAHARVTALSSPGRRSTDDPTSDRRLVFGLPSQLRRPGASFTVGAIAVDAPGRRTRHG